MNYTLELVFKGSRDGFDTDDMLRVFKDKPNTLSVVESEHGAVFGGFSSHAWVEYGEW